MRSSKNRSRSKNRNRPSGGNVVSRVFDSSGPEGKVRGTPQQIIEKYSQLARDAQLAGDRVAVENFQQHAEHYTRMLAEAQKEIESKREQQDREQQARTDRERSERDSRDARRADQNDRGDGRNDDRGDGRHDDRGNRQNEGRNDDRGDGSQDRPHEADAGADVMDLRGEDGPVDVPEAAAGASPPADAAPGEAPAEPRKPRTRRPRKPRNDPREGEAQPAHEPGGPAAE